MLLFRQNEKKRLFKYQALKVNIKKNKSKHLSLQNRLKQSISPKDQKR